MPDQQGHGEPVTYAISRWEGSGRRRFRTWANVRDVLGEVQREPQAFGYPEDSVIERLDRTLIEGALRDMPDFDDLAAPQLAKLLVALDEALAAALDGGDKKGEAWRCPTCGSDDPADRFSMLARGRAFDAGISGCPNPFHDGGDDEKGEG